MIGMNIVNSSFKYNVKKLINLGSSCIYPRDVKQPISENSLLSSNIIKPPQPPGPGFPLQAPSVAASIAIQSLFMNFEADI